MTAVVLESEIGSEYDDSPTGYEFPSRYLRFFERASDGGPLFAVIYEPRGENGRGRMAYVALAEIVGTPEPGSRLSKSGAQLWRVNYRTSAEPFATPVSREWLGRPIETWLRDFDRGRQRNVATVGRAVRLLSDEDLQTILTLAGTPAPQPSTYPTVEDEREASTIARERTELLVNTFIREASFRRDVLEAYENRCAITGLGIGLVAPTKSKRLLDAAHIRPVVAGGPDRVANGLPMTPTVHRMFDAGLIAVQYADDIPRLRLSARLESSMIAVPDREMTLGLRDELPLLTPRSKASWPHRDYLQFHFEQVFQK